MSLRDKVTTRTIDGLKVSMSPLPARFVNQWLVRLGGHLAPLVGMIAGVRDMAKDVAKAGGVLEFDTDTISDAKLGQLGAALQAVFSRLDAREVDAVFDAMLGRTTVELDGNICEIVGQEAFDFVFTGRAATSWKILGMSLVENYRDFFGGALGALLSGAKAAAMKAATKAAALSASD